MIKKCAEIVIAAKHHELIKVKDTRGTTHTVGALRCRFEFRTADWDYSIRTAMFCKGDAILHPEVADSAIAVPLDEDNECAVPYEVLTNTLPYSIGVWGVTDDGIRIVSGWLVFNAQPGCYTDGNAPADPEPTIYEQILTISHNALGVANDVLDKANRGEFDGEAGPEGVGIERIEKRDEHENIDIYAITLTNGSEYVFEVTNGLDGDGGEPGLTPYVGENGNWWIGDEDTEIKADYSGVYIKRLDSGSDNLVYVERSNNRGIIGYKLSQNVIANGIPERDSSGDIQVPETPSRKTSAASKQYVDSKIEEVSNVNIDLTDYVKNTDYATADTAGVIKVRDGTNGLKMYKNGWIGLNGATQEEVLNKTTGSHPLYPSHIDNIVKAGITSNKNTLDYMEKHNARRWLGIDEALEGALEEAKKDMPVKEVKIGSSISLFHEQDNYATVGFEIRPALSHSVEMPIYYGFQTGEEEWWESSTTISIPAGEPLYFKQLAPDGNAYPETVGVDWFAGASEDPNLEIIDSWNAFYTTDRYTLITGDNVRASRIFVESGEYDEEENPIYTEVATKDDLDNINVDLSGYVTKEELGDISSALDTLHNYAQSLVSGGEGE